MNISATEISGEQREDAIKRLPVAEVIRITRGLFADVPTSSDDFAKRKQIEIDLEQNVA